MAGEGVHVRHELRAAFGRSRAADPASERDTHTGGLALEGTEHEFPRVTVRAALRRRVQQVEPRPVELRQRGIEQR